MENLFSVKIEVFVPIEYVDAVRIAVGEIGAGHIGNYDYCASVTNVQGYWRPLTNASPFQGEIGKVEQGNECKIEINCISDQVKEVIHAIRNNHPYEEPVINVIALANHLFQ